MATIGYARTSTVDQMAGFDSQLAELKAQNCQPIFQEQVSSIGQRKQLEEAIKYAREGDVFIVTKLDRLARNTAHLLDIVQRLEKKGASVRILNLNLDTSTTTGKMLLTMLAAVAEFERGIMLERQHEGIAKAKADGKYRGRAPTARSKAVQVKALISAGKTRTDVAEELGIGIASVYRILAAAKTEKAA